MHEKIVNSIIVDKKEISNCKISQIIRKTESDANDSVAFVLIKKKKKQESNAVIYRMIFYRIKSIFFKLSYKKCQVRRFSLKVNVLS